MSQVAQRLPYPIYRAIRKRRVERRVRRFPSRLHTGIYGGQKLTLSLQDPLANGWYGHDWPALPEIDLLADELVGGRVFDLGAHQGVVALMLSRYAEDVLAVEAEPHNARVAIENKRLNAAENMTILNAAVDEQPGAVRFAVGLNGQIGTSRLGSEVVKAVTIDSLAERYGMPDVVFLDIEGHEGRALRGGRRVLESGASFFVEVHVDRLVNATVEEIVGRFPGHRLRIARDPKGDKATHDFEPLEGLPKERFYLVATDAINHRGPTPGAAGS